MIREMKNKMLKFNVENSTYALELIRFEREVIGGDIMSFGPIPLIRDGGVFNLKDIKVLM